MGAVQGRPVVLNESQNLVTRLVTLERIGGYRVDEEARDVLGLVPQFGGTVGGFRRSALDGFGGFDESMLTEDTDLTFHLYREGYKFVTWRTRNVMRRRWIVGGRIGGNGIGGQRVTCKSALNMPSKFCQAKK